MRWRINIRKSIIALVLTYLIGNISLACEPYEQEVKSRVSHLYLYEKDPVTWNIISNGSWGKIENRLSEEEFEFVFNGYKLNVGHEYTLICYPDPWPGEGLICLGNSTVNKEGNIHITKSVETSDLLTIDDENEGVKIWLVLSSDVDFVNSKMIEWNPTDYLFEHNLIYFSKMQTVESSEKDCKEIKKSEKEINENKGEENSKELAENDFLKPNWIRCLDKLIERFPVIEDILRIILEWIYNKIIST